MLARNFQLNPSLSLPVESLPYTTMLKVQLFGQFSVTFDGVPLTTLHTPRLQALFTYLLIYRAAPVPRDQLAYLFWPDSKEAQARTNLRNLVHQMRQALPECDRFLYSDTHCLQWRQESPFTLDTADFERCLEVEPAKRLPREALEQAVRIYQGDLLPGCYEDWILPERERLRAAYLHSLKTLAVIAEDARDYLLAVDYANRLVRAEPLLPAANQQLIRLYSLLGDRPAAVKAYEAYARLLQDELGVEPDEEIQDLYERIRQPRDMGARLAAPSAVSLIGRQVEWRQILSIWQTASRGGPQIVFITGEAGIGKTRLVEELASWATLQGMRAPMAYCYPAEGSLPYAQVVTWLRAQPLPALEKTWLVEIARLMPEILQKYPGLPKVEPLHEAWQRQRLFEALARALLLPRQKLILILDDIQWCDRDTLEWLHYLLRFDSSAPLLVLATARSGEIALDSPLATLQSALRSEGRYHEIELGPLSENDTVYLASQIYRENPPYTLNPDEATRIYRESEGNPLFTIEMARLEQANRQNGSAGGHRLEDSERVRGVLSQRISQLSPNAREVACVAAILGREFNMDVLYRAGDEPHEHIARAIDEMLQKRIIREISPDAYDFTHDKLRQAAFSEWSSAHRCLIHRKVAEAYLRLDESSPRPRNAEIASHYEHAGLPLLAVEHYRLAAETSSHIFANAEAQRYLQRAVDLAESLGVDQPTGISSYDFACLLARWGDMLALNGHYPQAQSAFERALNQPYAFSGIWRSQIYRKMSDALVPQYLHDQAHAALDQAEQALGLMDREGTEEEQQEWIQIQLARSQLFYWSNQPEQIEAIVPRIEPVVEKYGRLDQCIYLLNQHCLSRTRRERYRLSWETVQMVQRGLELAEKLADPYIMALTWFQLGFSLLWYGDPGAARPWLEKGYEATARLGVRLWQVRSLAYLSVVCRKLNDLKSVRELIPELLDRSSMLDEPTYHGIGLANQGWLAWR
ncbi:MAG: ATP-binding protein, partial [Omnitrophica WOR_2 bacterium]